MKRFTPGGMKIDKSSVKIELKSLLSFDFYKRNPIYWNKLKLNLRWLLKVPGKRITGLEIAKTFFLAPFNWLANIKKT